MSVASGSSSRAPEFKPQYHQKKKKNKKLFITINNRSFVQGIPMEVLGGRSELGSKNLLIEDSQVIQVQSVFHHLETTCKLVLIS
jgi:hypothetical protein